jgi:hypothetical protein
LEAQLPNQALNPFSVDNNSLAAKFVGDSPIPITMMGQAYLLDMPTKL